MTPAVPVVQTIFRDLNSLEVRIISVARHDGGARLAEMSQNIDDVEAEAVAAHTRDLAAIGVLRKTRAGRYSFNEAVRILPENERPGAAAEERADPVVAWAATALRRVVQAMLSAGPASASSIAAASLAPMEIVARSLDGLRDIGQARLGGSKKAPGYRLTESSSLKTVRMSRQDDLAVQGVFEKAFEEQGGVSSASGMLEGLLVRELSSGGQGTAAALASACGDAPAVAVSAALARMVASKSAKVDDEVYAALATEPSERQKLAQQQARRQLGGSVGSKKGRDVILQLLTGEPMTRTEIAAALNGRIAFRATLKKLVSEGAVKELAPTAAKGFHASYVAKGGKGGTARKLTEKARETLIEKLAVMRAGRLHHLDRLSKGEPSLKRRSIEELERLGLLVVTDGGRAILTEQGLRSKQLAPVTKDDVVELAKMSLIRRKTLIALHVLEQASLSDLWFCFEYHVPSLYEGEIGLLKDEIGELRKLEWITASGSGKSLSLRLGPRMETMIAGIADHGLWSDEELNYIRHTQRTTGHDIK